MLTAEERKDCESKAITASVLLIHQVIDVSRALDKTNAPWVALFTLQTMLLGHYHSSVVTFNVSKDTVIAELDAFYEKAFSHIQNMDIEKEISKIKEKSNLFEELEKVMRGKK